jgi:hypothetical protein
LRGLSGCSILDEKLGGLEAGTHGRMLVIELLLVPGYWLLERIKLAVPNGIRSNPLRSADGAREFSTTERSDFHN